MSVDTQEIMLKAGNESQDLSVDSKAYSKRSSVSGVNFSKALHMHLQSQASPADGQMNKRMDFFNSLLDKTSQNIQQIQTQLSQIQESQMALYE